ncbi:MAG: metallophosphoesterase family protein [Trueperaceae bacterium]|nr:metallophosphoesterase family protein [Trueperaceae bacterium]
MRIGVLSDVHANLPALRAALAALDGAQVDATLCLGDVVGYGPHPNETIRLLREREVTCTLGGADARVAFPVGEADAPRAGVADATLAWTRDVLEPAALAWLRERPTQVRLRTPGGCVRAVHGRVGDPWRRLDVRATPQELLRTFDAVGCPVLALGGRHVPYVRTLDGKLAVDPGSVGLSLNGEPGADYAVLDVREGDATAQLGKAEYDVEAVAFDVLGWGLPAAVADAVREGRLAPDATERGRGSAAPEGDD